MLAHKQNHSPNTRNALRAARSKAQQTARHCANEYWQNLCAKIQIATDCSHAKATGPTSVKTAPLKSKTGEVITDHSMQLQRWVEDYLELYSTQNIVRDTALNALPGFPVIEELDNTHTGRAQYSHRQSCLWQGTGEGRYPAKRFKAWEANHPATAS